MTYILRTPKVYNCNLKKADKNHKPSILCRKIIKIKATLVEVNP